MQGVTTDPDVSVVAMTGLVVFRDDSKETRMTLVDSRGSLVVGGRVPEADADALVLESFSSRREKEEGSESSSSSFPARLRLSSPASFVKLDRILERCTGLRASVGKRAGEGPSLVLRARRASRVLEGGELGFSGSLVVDKRKAEGRQDAVKVEETIASRHGEMMRVNQLRMGCSLY